MDRDVDNSKLLLSAATMQTHDRVQEMILQHSAQWRFLLIQPTVKFPEHYVGAAARPLTSISDQRVNQFSFDDSLILSQECRAEHTGRCNEDAVCRIAMKGIRQRR